MNRFIKLQNKSLAKMTKGTSLLLLSVFVLIACSTGPKNTGAIRAIKPEEERAKEVEEKQSLFSRLKEGRDKNKTDGLSEEEIQKEKEEEKGSGLFSRFKKDEDESSDVADMTDDSPSDEPSDRSTSKNNTKVSASSRPKPLVDKEVNKLYKKGIKAMRAKKFDEAKSIFEQVEALAPELSGPRTNIALIHTRKGEYKEAEKELKKALEINPENEFALNSLGVVYREQGKFNEAKEAYYKSVEINPEYAEAYYNLGVLAEIYLRDKELALSSFQNYQSNTRRKDKTVETWIKDLSTRIEQERAAREAERLRQQQEALEQANQAGSPENDESGETSESSAGSTQPEPETVEEQSAPATESPSSDQAPIQEQKPLQKQSPGENLNPDSEAQPESNNGAKNSTINNQLYAISNKTSRVNKANLQEYRGINS